MTRILYIADPNSIHDVKWMSWFADKSEYEVFMLCRKKHVPAAEVPNIALLGDLDDYSVFKPWKNRNGKQKLQKIIEEKQIDVLHVFYAEPNILWVNVIESNIPVVLTTRGSDVLVGLKKFIERSNWKDKKLIKHYRKAIKKCSAIVSTSHRQMEFLEANFSLPERTEIIRTGIDVSALQKPSEDRKTIFFPRAMRPLYQHEQALEAIVRLPKKTKKEYRFVFINKDSSNTKYVRSIEKQMEEISDLQIDFLDNLDPKAYFEMLSKSKVVVMTPRSDGAPVSGMEAIAVGCQLVLPDLGYDPDLFDSAYFYKQNDIVSLTETIVNAIEAENKIADSDYLKKVDRDIQMTHLANIYGEIAG